MQDLKNRIIYMKLPNRGIEIWLDECCYDRFIQNTNEAVAKTDCFLLQKAFLMYLSFSPPLFELRKLIPLFKSGEIRAEDFQPAALIQTNFDVMFRVFKVKNKE